MLTYACQKYGNINNIREDVTETSEKKGEIQFAFCILLQYQGK